MVSDRFEDFDIGFEVGVVHNTEEYSIPEKTDNANEMSDEDMSIGTFFEKVKSKRLKRYRKHELQNSELKTKISKLQAEADTHK